jgi:hypothetical protein
VIIAVKKGESITSPTLPLTAPVIVQWHRTGSDTCWEATYTSADILTETATQFTASTR